MSGLIVNTPADRGTLITIDELKCLYTLWVYEEITLDNTTQTADLLRISRPTARAYIDRGRKMRGRRPELIRLLSFRWS